MENNEHKVLNPDDEELKGKLKMSFTKGQVKIRKDCRPYTSQHD